MQEILEKPTCSNCGFKVETDCVVGAGCPNCGRRLFPEERPTAAAGPGDADFAVLRGELDRLAGENVQLRARVAELEEKAAKAAKGGSHGGA